MYRVHHRHHYRHPGCRRLGYRRLGYRRHQSPCHRRIHKRRFSLYILDRTRIRGSGFCWHVRHTAHSNTYPMIHNCQYICTYCSHTHPLYRLGIRQTGMMCLHTSRCLGTIMTDRTSRIYFEYMYRYHLWGNGSHHPQTPHTRMSMPRCGMHHA